MAGLTYVNGNSSNEDDDAEILLWDDQQLHNKQQFTLPVTTDYTGSLIHKQPYEEPTEEAMEKFASLGIGIASLFTECILTHPCIVIRRQCQVHAAAVKYHITPFTLLPVVLNLQRRQGISSLWKGMGSCFILRGLTLGIEDVISKFTPMPKEITRHNSMTAIANHLLLKGATFMLVTPFISASLVESIQSDIASEKPGIFDCIKEGFRRVFHPHAAATSHLLPIWCLVGPTVIMSLIHYIVKASVQFIAMRTFEMKEVARQEGEKKYSFALTTADRCLLDLRATYVSHFIADVLLYPLETVVYRLHVQGTRTITDNLDTGKEVIPIITRYVGFFDCFNNIVNDEGVAGLYKGFGALLAQYAIRVSIFKLTRYIYRELYHRNDCKTEKRSGRENNF